MDRILALRTLIAVVDHGGFAAAAKALGLSPPAVTRQVAALEAELKTQLMVRSTRSLAMTDAGAGYIADVRQILADLQQADDRLHGQSLPSFTRLRVATHSSVAPLVSPAFARFLVGFPHIMGELHLLDRPVDGAHEGYDAVISLEQPGAAQTPLARLEAALVAAPAYCARHGRPKAPDELGAHQGLLKAGEEAWKLRNGEAVSLKMRATSNLFSSLREFCLAGLGIAVMPHFLVQRDIAAGNLIQLLDGFEPKPYELLLATEGSDVRHDAGQTFAKYLEAEIKRRPP
jgi:DNA-binding transcriptional LysR family regulator